MQTPYLILPKKLYEEALHEFLYDIPPNDLPPLLNVIVSRFRKGEYDENYAKAKLEKYRLLIEAWKKNNVMIDILLRASTDDLA